MCLFSHWEHLMSRLCELSHTMNHCISTLISLTCGEYIIIIMWKNEKGNNSSVCSKCVNNAYNTLRIHGVDPEVAQVGGFL